MKFQEIDAIEEIGRRLRNDLSCLSYSFINANRVAFYTFMFYLSVDTHYSHKPSARELSVPWNLKPYDKKCTNQYSFNKNQSEKAKKANGFVLNNLKANGCGNIGGIRMTSKVIVHDC